MRSSETGRVFFCFILCTSVIEVKPDRVCALKGSSVNLTCSAPRSHTNRKWHSQSSMLEGYYELPADGDDGKYRISEDSFNTLTIRNLTKSDESLYCCCEAADTQSCVQRSIELRVADLQVKVFPVSDAHKVTLMCTSSCSLTEPPAAFIWYQNTDFLYEDWSPWYQELVHSEDAVRYSCSVKGSEEIRSPEVSVDSVTSTCFSVTYTGGTMCRQTSVSQSCSITYPRELHVEITDSGKTDHVRLSCNISCPLIDSLNSFKWYRDRKIDQQRNKQQILVPISSPSSFSCSVIGHEDLHSAEVCVSDCWSLNSISRRICALKGSSVNISSKYSHPKSQQPQSKLWYKVKTNAHQKDKKPLKNTDNVEFQDMKNEYILRLKNLQKNDSAEYRFKIKTQHGGDIQSDFSGVTLIVTDLRVDIGPAAEVTEGQRVTLTCRTSCPLMENTNYIWYKNHQPLNLKPHNKQLVINAVSSRDAGNYSCAVKSNKLIFSALETLTVQSKTGNWIPAVPAVFAVLLVVFAFSVFLFKKLRNSRSFSHDPADHMKQLNSGATYEEISAQPAEPELYYSEISNVIPNPVYSTLQPHQQQDSEPEVIQYAEVKI